MTGALAPNLTAVLESASPLRPHDDAETLTAEELQTVELVNDVRGNGSLDPLIAQLGNGEIGPDHARDALLVLADYDVDVLVQVTLDTLSRHTPSAQAGANAPCQQLIARVSRY